jgi:7,8-dihydropterin-6-yl-methyl-4-(beta-D-ribofuranosyl)aminobenzene 5'-phosphate synthase
MKITSLMDNECSIDGLLKQHGLSLLIESKGKKILFDTGADSGFIRNAETLNIDLSDVDVCVLSHGHYDHGGGLNAFFKINDKSLAYMSALASNDHVALRPNGEYESIGINISRAYLDRLVFVDKELKLDNGLIFSEVWGYFPLPIGNRSLFKEKGGAYVLDDFAHEQHLVVEEDGKFVLFAGCAHRGILNVLTYLKDKYGILCDVVVGGFHLHNKVTNTYENPQVLDTLAKELMNTFSKFYTCHCTGIPAYSYLKVIMKDQIDYLSTGVTIEV